jgi:hypothetical protein
VKIMQAAMDDLTRTWRKLKSFVDDLACERQQYVAWRAFLFSRTPVELRARAIGAAGQPPRGLCWLARAPQ